MDKYLIRNSEAERKKSEARDQLLAQISYANTHIFGNSSFRDQQHEIITTIMENNDVFIILPTGMVIVICLNYFLFFRRWEIIMLSITSNLI